MSKCEICGTPSKDDFFAYVAQEPVCSICKLKYLGRWSATPDVIAAVRKYLGLDQGEFLAQDNPKEAAKILGR